MNLSLKVLSAVVFLVFSGLTQVAAESSDSTVYVKSVLVDQVGPHKLGYKVWYRSADGTQQVAYLPIDWFYGTAGKAQIVQVWDSSSPYLEVFYKDNAFWYLRLHVAPTFDDPSWTVLRDAETMDGFFKVDTLKLTY